MIILVTGPVHAGKTTRVRTLVERMAATGVPLAGYLSRAVREGSGIVGYDLEVVGTGETQPFLRRTEAGKSGRRDLEAGSFRFVPAGLNRAREIVRGSRAGGLLVVDEVGPAELEGRGIWPPLEAQLRDPERKLLLVVRDSLLETVLERLPGRPAVVRFDAEDAGERLLEEMGR